MAKLANKYVIKVEEKRLFVRFYFAEKDKDKAEKFKLPKKFAKRYFLNGRLDVCSTGKGVTNYIRIAEYRMKS